MQQITTIRGVIWHLQSCSASVMVCGCPQGFMPVRWLPPDFLLLIKEGIIKDALLICTFMHLYVCKVAGFLT